MNEIEILLIDFAKDDSAGNKNLVYKIDIGDSIFVRLPNMYIKEPSVGKYIQISDVTLIIIKVNNNRKYWWQFWKSNKPLSCIVERVK